MLSSNGVTLRFGKRVLFEDVTIKFTKNGIYANPCDNACFVWGKSRSGVFDFPHFQLLRYFKQAFISHRIPVVACKQLYIRVFICHRHSDFLCFNVISQWDVPRRAHHAENEVFRQNKSLKILEYQRSLCYNQTTNFRKVAGVWQV